jgi:hypothetical protein
MIIICYYKSILAAKSIQKLTATAVVYTEHSTEPTTRISKTIAFVSPRTNITVKILATSLHTVAVT